jgi:hypothetical protein
MDLPVNQAGSLAMDFLNGSLWINKTGATNGWVAFPTTAGGTNTIVEQIGPGTVNFIPKWSGTNTLDDSPLKYIGLSTIQMNGNATSFGGYNITNQFSLTNSTAADVSNTQRYPPLFAQTGQMWNTTSNASHTVTFLQNVVPVGGATSSEANSSLSWNATLVQGSTVTTTAPFSFNTAGDAIIARNATIRGLSYIWPVANAGGPLVNNGSGTLSWGTNVITTSLILNGITKTQKTALTPTDGMIVYQTDNTPGFRGYVNGTWFIFSMAADP